MKKIVIPTLAFLIISCSKETPTQNTSDNLDAAPQVVYDTMAIDSFGPGATSESVMAKINAVAIKKEQDSLAKIAKAEQEKLNKEMAEEVEKRDKEAQKRDNESKKETKPEATPEPATNP